jgi:hypothetical protein
LNFAVTNVESLLEMSLFSSPGQAAQRVGLSPNVSPYPQLHMGLSTFQTLYGEISLLLNDWITHRMGMKRLGMANDFNVNPRYGAYRR